MQQLYDKAIELLARREHSQLELKQKLLQRGFLLEEIENLLIKLADTKLQSEQRFIEAYIHRRIKAGYGPKKIAAELRHRGIIEIPKEILEEESSDWAERLAKVWRRKFSTLPKSQQDYIKQMNFLIYRGFNTHQIQQLLKGSFF